MAELSEADKEWVRRRTAAVRTIYTAFQCLHENGRGDSLVDPNTPIQIFCPFHHNVNTAAARYYPAIGGRSDYVHCFACKKSWDAINLHMGFRGLPFMDALKELERRFKIKIPKRPEGSPIAEPKDKSSSNYVSEAWADVPRMMAILEKKLRRIRDITPLPDYVKFCRVLDIVQWDFDQNQGKPTPDMIAILQKLQASMNNVREIDLN